MSVLIKGMEMPEICNVCGFCQRLENATRYKFIYCGADRKDIPDLSKKRDDCPLIELPPHGDLVDKQQMAETNEQHYLVCKGEPNADYAREVVLRMLDQAPTIIEAEVEE